MFELKELLRLPDAERDQLDLAELNLSCSLGLPGIDGETAADCLRTVGEWTDLVAYGTKRVEPHFLAHPAEYDNSRAVFRVMTMVTILQRNLGIRYDPPLMPEDAGFAAEDNFLYGVVRRRLGSCANLPVLYAAIGRRLGYPLKLVQAKGHLFTRWDGEGERFNIEATSVGFVSPPDGYYTEGRYAATPKEVERGNFLRSMTPRQEFANSLAQRGYARLEADGYPQAIKSFAWADALAPENVYHSWCVVAVLERLEKRATSTSRPNLRFNVALRHPARLFPKMPCAIERRIIRAEVQEWLLTEKLDSLGRTRQPVEVNVAYAEEQMFNL